jgi:hypothetical protein
MFNRSRGILVAVMALGLAGGLPSIGMPATLPLVTNVSKKQRRGLFNGKVVSSMISTKYPTERISVAQGKRNASKARAVQRFKAAVKHRGSLKKPVFRRRRL